MNPPSGRWRPLAARGTDSTRTTKATASDRLRSTGTARVDPGPLDQGDHMDFGIAFANTGPYTTGEGAVTLTRAAEDAGFESLWTVEHVIVPAGYQSEYPYDPSGKMPGGESFDIPDPLVWLTWVGANSTRLTLGTGVLILPQRNPGVLAKECATLDAMSGGRVRLGIGVGWLEEEFDALGVSFADRGARTDEYVAEIGRASCRE